jgi:hypothetical protein
MLRMSFPRRWPGGGRRRSRVPLPRGTAALHRAGVPRRYDLETLSIRRMI